MLNNPNNADPLQSAGETLWGNGSADDAPLHITILNSFNECSVEASVCPHYTLRYIACVFQERLMLHNDPMKSKTIYMNTRTGSMSWEGSNCIAALQFQTGDTLSIYPYIHFN
jgi:hypothetical protein